jgi:DTW domain-containing protein
VRSRTAPDGGGRCPRCALHQGVCACALLVALPIRTRFLVLRHVREAEKSSNTARWAALLVPGCELRPWSGRHDAAVLGDVGRPGDCLLFPTEPASTPGVRPEPPPERVIVLDGTWRQVRRMLRALPAVQGLPRLTVAPRAGGPRLRAAPAPSFLSTLEAMTGAVALLEGEASAADLDTCRIELVGRALAARGKRLSEAA